MFDTMTLTKSAGALCGSLLVFLLGGWAAEALYSTGEGHGGEHAQGYVVDTGSDEAEEKPAEQEPDLAQMFASADPSKGEKIFNQCRACHMLKEGQNAVGPSLYGVVGRDVGSVGDFNYSGALSKVNDVWSADELFAFLKNPQGYAPGTAMGYSGLEKPKDRVNLIAYLDETDGTDDIELASTGGGTTDASANDGSGTGGMESSGSDQAEGSAGASGSSGAGSDTADGQGGSGTDMAEASSSAGSDMTSDTSNGAQDMASAQGSSDTSGSGAASSGGDMSDFAKMVASADPEAGKKVFRQCQACHQAEKERNGVGPYLVGVVGRDIASVDNYTYSDSLSGLDGAWTVDKLNHWIENPRKIASGTKMGYGGLSDEQDRAALVAYLKSTGN